MGGIAGCCCCAKLPDSFPELEIEGTTSGAWEQVFGGGTGSCCWTKLFTYTETQPWVYELGGLMATVTEDSVRDFDRVLVYTKFLDNPGVPGVTPATLIREMDLFNAGNQTINSNYTQEFYFASAYRKTSVRITLGTVVADCPDGDPIKKWSVVIDMIGEVKAVAPVHFESSTTRVWTANSGCYNAASGWNDTTTDSNADVGEAGFYDTGTESDPVPMTTRYSHLKDSLSDADFFEPTGCEEICGGCSVPCSDPVVLVGEPDLPSCSSVVAPILNCATSKETSFDCGTSTLTTTTGTLVMRYVSGTCTDMSVTGELYSHATSGSADNRDLLNASTNFGTGCSTGTQYDCFGSPGVARTGPLVPHQNWNEYADYCELEEFSEISIEVSIPLVAITVT
jgi:hypothetical protein